MRELSEFQGGGDELGQLQQIGDVWPATEGPAHGTGPIHVGDSPTTHWNRAGSGGSFPGLGGHYDAV